MFEDFFESPCRIVPAGKRTELYLLPRYEQRQFGSLEKPLVLKMISCSGLLADGVPADWNGFDTVPFRLSGADKEKLLYSVFPKHEGELFFRLESDSKPVAEWSLYALNEDLYGLRAYRGDLHIHSSFSACGTRDENPCFVAAQGRKLGLDFLAITDHLQREPSGMAQEFIRESGSELQVYPGEEIHMLKGRMASLLCINRFHPHNHIVSVGAAEGVCAWMNCHFDEYDAALRRRAAEIPGEDTPEAKYAMAASDWIFDKIHEFGGLGIFCHPFWKPHGRLNLPENVREYILQQNKFDVLELTALQGALQEPELNEGNFRNLAWYEDACIRRGARIPVAGNTDCHLATKELGYQYSLVFAASPAWEDISCAIRQGRSVAATHYPGQMLNLYGDLRLVSYGYFLEREIMPEHDEMCRADGLKLLAKLRDGNPEA